jgi:RHS repeat-associated protein
MYQTDHLGSPRNWYRVSDGVQGEAEYSAYGVRTVTSTGPGVPEQGYTGHLHHTSSGLVLAPYRAYDPELGRWLSEDPIGERGGLNLYGYVRNGPITKNDPLGLQCMGSASPGGAAAMAGALSDPVWGGAATKVAAEATASTGILTALWNWIFGDEDEIEEPPIRKPPPPGRPKPRNTPPGTKPIDQCGLPTDTIHDIKDGIKAEPNDYVGIAPDGSIIWNDADDDNGNLEDYQ